MNKLKLVVLFGLLVSGIANAATDYTCLNECLSTGRMYGLCMKQCSYNHEEPKSLIGFDVIIASDKQLSICNV